MPWVVGGQVKVRDNLLFSLFKARSYFMIHRLSGHLVYFILSVTIGLGKERLKVQLISVSGVTNK